MNARVGIAPLLPLPDVPRSTHRSPAQPAAVWSLSAFSGRLGEISGADATAALTLAFRLVLEAQRLGEPVVWITQKGSTFYPPDVARTAVDLEALVVVRVQEIRQAARAADQLVRSGAFGLVVLDLGARARLAPPALSRLGGLAKKHDAAILCITEKETEQPSLGPLISIRAEAVRARKAENVFQCEARILKDKRRGPGRTHVEVCHGPDGVH